MTYVYSHLVEAVRSAEDIAVINESAPADHLKAFNIILEMGLSKDNFGRLRGQLNCASDLVSSYVPGMIYRLDVRNILPGEPSIKLKEGMDKSMAAQEQFRAIKPKKSEMFKVWWNVN